MKSTELFLLFYVALTLCEALVDVDTQLVTKSVIDSDNPFLLKLLQSVDEASSNEHLFHVTLKLLKSLCVCMRETLKEKQRNLSFNGETNAIYVEDSHENDAKVLELYKTIYNKTCFNLQNDLVKHNMTNNDHMSCGKSETFTEKATSMANYGDNSVKNEMDMKSLLFKSLILTRRLHNYTVTAQKLYNKYRASFSSLRNNVVIFLITPYPDNNHTEETNTTDEHEFNRVLFTNSPVEITILTSKQEEEPKKDHSKVNYNVSECNLQSIYTFLIKSDIHNFTKKFRILKQKGLTRMYIETLENNNTDYLNMCCDNNTKIPECTRNTLMESKTENKSNDTLQNYKDTIAKIKHLVKLYKKRARRQDKLNDNEMLIINSIIGEKYALDYNFNETDSNSTNKSSSQLSKHSVRNIIQTMESALTSTTEYLDFINSDMFGHENKTNNFKNTKTDKSLSEKSIEKSKIASSSRNELFSTANGNTRDKVNSTFLATFRHNESNKSQIPYSKSALNPTIPSTLMNTDVQTVHTLPKIKKDSQESKATIYESKFANTDNYMISEGTIIPNISHFTQISMFPFTTTLSGSNSEGLKHFLALDRHDFVSQYGSYKRIKKTNNDIYQLVDILVNNTKAEKTKTGFVTNATQNENLEFVFATNTKEQVPSNAGIEAENINNALKNITLLQDDTRNNLSKGKAKVKNKKAKNNKKETKGMSTNKLNHTISSNISKKKSEITNDKMEKSIENMTRNATTNFLLFKSQNENTTFKAMPIIKLTPKQNNTQSKLSRDKLKVNKKNKSTKTKVTRLRSKSAKKIGTKMTTTNNDKNIFKSVATAIIYNTKSKNITTLSSTPIKPMISATKSGTKFIDISQNTIPMKEDTEMTTMNNFVDVTTHFPENSAVTEPLFYSLRDTTKYSLRTTKKRLKDNVIISNNSDFKNYNEYQQIFVEKSENQNNTPNSLRLLSSEFELYNKTNLDTYSVLNNTINVDNITSTNQSIRKLIEIELSTKFPSSFTINIFNKSTITNKYNNNFKTYEKIKSFTETFDKHGLSMSSELNSGGSGPEKIIVPEKVKQNMENDWLSEFLNDKEGTADFDLTSSSTKATKAYSISASSSQRLNNLNLKNKPTSRHNKVATLLNSKKHISKNIKEKSGLRNKFINGTKPIETMIDESDNQIDNATLHRTNNVTKHGKNLDKMNKVGALNISTTNLTELSLIYVQSDDLTFVNNTKTTTFINKLTHDEKRTTDYNQTIKDVTYLPLTEAQMQSTKTTCVKNKITLPYITQTPQTAITEKDVPTGYELSNVLTTSYMQKTNDMLNNDNNDNNLFTEVYQNYDINKTLTTNDFTAQNIVTENTNSLKFNLKKYKNLNVGKSNKVKNMSRIATEFLTTLQNNDLQNKNELKKSNLSNSFYNFNSMVTNKPKISTLDVQRSKEYKPIYTNNELITTSAYRKQNLTNYFDNDSAKITSSLIKAYEHTLDIVTKKSLNETSVSETKMVKSGLTSPVTNMDFYDISKETLSEKTISQSQSMNINSDVKNMNVNRSLELTIKFENLTYTTDNKRTISIENVIEIPNKVEFQPKISTIYPSKFGNTISEQLFQRQTNIVKGLFKTNESVTVNNYNETNLPSNKNEVSHYYDKSKPSYLEAESTPTIEKGSSNFETTEFFYKVLPSDSRTLPNKTEVVIPNNVFLTTVSIKYKPKGTAKVLLPKYINTDAYTAVIALPKDAKPNKSNVVFKKNKGMTENHTDNNVATAETIYTKSIDVVQYFINATTPVSTTALYTNTSDTQKVDLKQAYRESFTLNEQKTQYRGIKSNNKETGYPSQFKIEYVNSPNMETTRPYNAKPIFDHLDNRDMQNLSYKYNESTIFFSESRQRHENLFTTLPSMKKKYMTPTMLLINGSSFTNEKSHPKSLSISNNSQNIPWNNSLFMKINKVNLDKTDNPIVNVSTRVAFKSLKITENTSKSTKIASTTNQIYGSTIESPFVSSKGESSYIYFTEAPFTLLHSEAPKHSKHKYRNGTHIKSLTKSNEANKINKSKILNKQITNSNQIVESLFREDIIEKLPNKNEKLYLVSDKLSNTSNQYKITTTKFSDLNIPVLLNTDELLHINEITELTNKTTLLENKEYSSAATIKPVTYKNSGSDIKVINHKKDINKERSLFTTDGLVILENTLQNDIYSNEKENTIDNYTTLTVNKDRNQTSSISAVTDKNKDIFEYTTSHHNNQIQSQKNISVSNLHENNHVKITNKLGFGSSKNTFFDEYPITSQGYTFENPEINSNSKILLNSNNKHNKNLISSGHNFKTNVIKDKIYTNILKTPISISRIMIDKDLRRYENPNVLQNSSQVYQDLISTTQKQFEDRTSYASSNNMPSYFQEKLSMTSPHIETISALKEYLLPIKNILNETKHFKHKYEYKYDSAKREKIRYVHKTKTDKVFLSKEASNKVINVDIRTKNPDYIKIVSKSPIIKYITTIPVTSEYLQSETKYKIGQVITYDNKNKENIFTTTDKNKFVENILTNKLKIPQYIDKILHEITQSKKFTSISQKSNFNNINFSWEDVSKVLTGTKPISHIFKTTKHSSNQIQNKFILPIEIFSYVPLKVKKSHPKPITHKTEKQNTKLPTEIIPEIAEKGSHSYVTSKNIYFQNGEKDILLKKNKKSQITQNYTLLTKSNSNYSQTAAGISEIIGKAEVSDTNYTEKISTSSLDLKFYLNKKFVKSGLHSNHTQMSKNNNTNKNYLAQNNSNINHIMPTKNFEVVNFNDTYLLNSTELNKMKQFLTNYMSLKNETSHRNIPTKFNKHSNKLKQYLNIYEDTKETIDENFILPATTLKSAITENGNFKTIKYNTFKPISEEEITLSSETSIKSDKQWLLNQVNYWSQTPVIKNTTACELIYNLSQQISKTLPIFVQLLKATNCTLVDILNITEPTQSTTKSAVPLSLAIRSTMNAEVVRKTSPVPLVKTNLFPVKFKQKILRRVNLKKKSSESVIRITPAHQTYRTFKQNHKYKVSDTITTIEPQMFQQRRKQINSFRELLPPNNSMIISPRSNIISQPYIPKLLPKPIIPRQKNILLRPTFQGTNPKDFKVEHFRPKPLLVEHDTDFHREDFRQHHKPSLSWRDKVKFIQGILHKNPPKMNYEDTEMVLEKPRIAVAGMEKPKFLRDRINSIRNYVFSADYGKTTARIVSKTYFFSPEFMDVSNEEQIMGPEPVPMFRRSRQSVRDLPVTLVTDWWLDDMYLKVRAPLPINSNPGMVFPRRHFAKMEEVADLGALFIDDLLDYKEMLDRGELPQERATSREKGQPLCMEQFYRLLGVCRNPGVGKDELALPSNDNDGEREELVIVACRNYFYPIPVKAADRGRLTAGEIQAQILHAMVDAAGAPPAPRVGLLTSMNRDSWAKAREQLMKDDNNRTNLELISRALCLLCVDEAGGDRADTDSDTNAILRAMHGAGTAHHSANRWFDKTVQLIISSDGTLGMCYEHSAAEGVAVVRLAERALARAEVSDRPAPPPVLLPAPQAMKWNVPVNVQRTIELAARDLDRAIANLDFKVYTYRGYGREFMKSCRTSPDVYIQLALQYAYYKMYGHLTSTYESASLRRFRSGRVDNIRSAHAPAKAWADTMCSAEAPQTDADDGQKKEQKKLELFDEAARKQTAIMEDNILGRGIDNHLLGLREAARETLGHLPQLFTDPVYQMMIEFKLSTSQVATTTEGTFMGYGPVVPDGYGCSYNPKKESIIFCISSFHSSSVTNTEAFRQFLEEALDSMKLMLQNRKVD